MRRWIEVHECDTDPKYTETPWQSMSMTLYDMGGLNRKDQRVTRNRYYERSLTCCNSRITCFVRPSGRYLHSQVYCQYLFASVAFFDALAFVSIFAGERWLLKHVFRMAFVFQPVGHVVSCRRCHWSSHIPRQRYASDELEAREVRGVPRAGVGAHDAWQVRLILFWVHCCGCVRADVDFDVRFCWI